MNNLILRPRFFFLAFVISVIVFIPVISNAACGSTVTKIYASVGSSGLVGVKATDIYSVNCPCAKTSYLKANIMDMAPKLGTYY